MHPLSGWKLSEWIRSDFSMAGLIFLFSLLFLPFILISRLGQVSRCNDDFAHPLRLLFCFPVLLDIVDKHAGFVFGWVSEGSRFMLSVH
jgi:hypothetical protein